MFTAHCMALKLANDLLFSLSLAILGYAAKYLYLLTPSVTYQSSSVAWMTCAVSPFHTEYVSTNFQMSVLTVKPAACSKLMWLTVLLMGNGALVLHLMHFCCCCVCQNLSGAVNHYLKFIYFSFFCICMLCVLPRSPLT